MLCYAALALLVPVLAKAVIQHYPENYSWQAEAAADSNDLPRAETILKARISNEYYDMAAQRQLAETYLQFNRNDRALQVVRELIKRESDSAHRKVFTIGSNTAAAYHLYSQALSATGKTQYADEMLRYANDLDFNTPLDFPRAHSAPGSVIWSPIKVLQAAPGVTPFNSSGLSFSKAESVTINIPAPGGISALAFEVAGGRVMGTGGILQVSSNSEELIQIYADSPQPRTVTIPFTHSSGAGNLNLTIKFLNDEYDPVSKVDRNVQILRVGYVNNSQ